MGRAQGRKYQFYRTVSPTLFGHERFMRWLSQIGPMVFLEPFAGDAAILRLLPHVEFKAFDLNPRHPAVQKQDTLKDFPVGFGAVITNPPYHRESATSNLWMKALDKCLANAHFVAVVVPQSFLALAIRYKRLQAVILATHRSTEGRIPVCLALFGPGRVPDFEVWQDQGSFVGFWKQIQAELPSSEGICLVTTDPVAGEVGLIAVDSYSGDSVIRFCRGDEVGPLRDSARAAARFRIPWQQVEAVGKLEELIAAANGILESLRLESADCILTPFFEHGRNGRVRRRLPFRLARRILAEALSLVEADSSSPHPPAVRLRTQKTNQRHAFPRASRSEEQTPYSAAG